VVLHPQLAAQLHNTLHTYAYFSGSKSTQYLIFLGSDGPSFYQELYKAALRCSDVEVGHSHTAGQGATKERR
jgi:hypothetical protein